MEEKSAPRRGRRGIARDDVRRACEALTVQGRRIGPTNVRLELGTGSYNTIVRLLVELGYANGVAQPGRKNVSSG